MNDLKTRNFAAQTLPASVLPEGWVAVPKIPTADMCNAGLSIEDNGGPLMPQVWAAMLSQVAGAQASQAATLGVEKVGSPPDAPAPLPPEIYSAEIEALRTELSLIANQDPVELMLDPQWASRIARAALDAHG